MSGLTEFAPAGPPGDAARLGDDDRAWIESVSPDQVVVEEWLTPDEWAAIDLSRTIESLSAEQALAMLASVGELRGQFGAASLILSVRRAAELIGAGHLAAEAVDLLRRVRVGPQRLWWWATLILLRSVAGWPAARLAARRLRRRVQREQLAAPGRPHRPGSGRWPPGADPPAWLDHIIPGCPHTGPPALVAALGGQPMSP